MSETIGCCTGEVAGVSSTSVRGQGRHLEQSFTGISGAEPLSACRTGDPRVLQATGARPEMARRLAALGLRRGAQLTLMMRTAGGGGIVSVAGARIALDHSMLAELFTVGPVGTDTKDPDSKDAA